MAINKKKPPLLTSRQLGGLAIAAAGLLLLGYSYFSRASQKEKIPRVTYSQFLQQVNQGKVKEVLVGEKEIRYKLKDKDKEEPGAILSTVPIFDLQLVRRLETKGVIFYAQNPQKNGWLGILLNWVIPPIILVAALQFFLRNNGKGSLSFGKSKAKVYVEGEGPKITFADVAGVEEAKTELAEIVQFLKHPQRFASIGARVPKGLLLVGPPGTGKTLLAKAVAGEAQVPFFSIGGSEFVELFVGTGAARVRDLFEQAKKQAPCIIFIDELDAIGKSRSGSGATYSGSNDEREQTLNQLLTEMDGFSGKDNKIAIVLAATNRPEILDPALLRPGRFDRQVLVDRPDKAGRWKILQVYAAKVKLEKEVDLEAIATRTPGFAGADLANLVNEAALLAARHTRKKVRQQDFDEAIERVVAGLEKRSRVLSDKEKKVVAYHEVGHALVGAVMPGGGKVAKISIVPRGVSALGYTLRMPTEDRFLLDELEFRQQITTLLGGRAAEEIVFGTVTNGASDDLQRATDLAEQMVTSYGMSKVLGPLAYHRGGGRKFLDNGNGNVRRLVSDETAKAIDEEVKEILECSHKEALAILQQNRDLMEKVAVTILEQEVIEGEELEGFLELVKQ